MTKAGINAKRVVLKIGSASFLKSVFHNRKVMFPNIGVMVPVGICYHRRPSSYHGMCLELLQGFSKATGVAGVSDDLTHTSQK